MISEFLSAACGRLSYLDPETKERIYATEFLKYGSGNGYWTSKRMISQVIDRAIPIFEKAYPRHIGVFAFDNSSGQACKAGNALVASRMNLLPGGKQPRMRDTILPGSIVQHMGYQPGDAEINNPHRPILTV